MTAATVLFKKYCSWLGDRSIQSPYPGKDGAVVIDTPFVNRDSDCIELAYKQMPDGMIRISDNGNTFGDLFTFLPKKATVDVAWKRCITIAERYGVTNENTELVVYMSTDDTQIVQHRLIMTVLACQELAWRQQVEEQRATITNPRFRTMVGDFLCEAKLPFERGRSFPGTSSISYKFDFYVTGKNKGLAIDAVNTMQEDTAIATYFSTKDVEEKLQMELPLFVLYRENDDEETKRSLEFLSDHDIPLFEWTNRSRLIETVREEIA
ncbi:MAG: DUF1828 domain-containing protein [Sphaerochaetaceae bacterium]|nr:DUF1828 domain-containing protein [Sphaerochaetaceae bacterium]